MLICDYFGVLFSDYARKKIYIRYSPESWVSYLLYHSPIDTALFFIPAHAS